jgi:hypothetical protein
VTRTADVGYDFDDSGNKGRRNIEQCIEKRIDSWEHFLFTSSSPLSGSFLTISKWLRASITSNAK